MYLIDVWTKPKLSVTALDELLIAGEMLAVFVVVIFACFVWGAIIAARAERREAAHREALHAAEENCLRLTGKPRI